jgi:hypothetical protein
MKTNATTRGPARENSKTLRSRVLDAIARRVLGSSRPPVTRTWINGREVTPPVRRSTELWLDLD